MGLNHWGRNESQSSQSQQYMTAVLGIQDALTASSTSASVSLSFDYSYKQIERFETTRNKTKGQD